MGSGAKIALVALLILMVVAVAKYVQKEEEVPATNETHQPVDGPRLANPKKSGNQNQPNRRRPPKITSRSQKENRTPARTVNRQGESRTSNTTIPPLPRTGPISSFAGQEQADLSLPAKRTSPPTLPPKEADRQDSNANIARGSLEPPQASSPKSGETLIADPKKPLVASKFGGESSEARGQTISPNPGGSPSPITAPPKEIHPPGEAKGLGTLVPKKTEEKSPPPSKPVTPSDPSRFPVQHTLVPGESYWRLAEIYYGAGKGYLYPVIVDANGNAKLIAGKTVTIPSPPVETPKTGTSALPGTVTSSSSGELTYIVLKGDTISEIAVRFKVAQSDIEDANPHLKYQVLRAGEKITIPKR